MKLGLLALLLASLSLADESVPETVVKIGILDLIPKQKIRKKEPAAPALPSGYGRELAEVVAAARTSLLACLPASETSSEAQVELTISPQGSGKAMISQAGANFGTCLEGVLAKLSYPAHPLKEPVMLRFPLKLARNQL